MSDTNWIDNHGGTIEKACPELCKDWICHAVWNNRTTGRWRQGATQATTTGGHYGQEYTTGYVELRNNFGIYDFFCACDG